MAYYPAHQATMPGEDLGTSVTAVRDSGTLSGISVEEEQRWQHRADTIHGPRR
jgi:hypothetical protein